MKVFIAKLRWLCGLQCVYGMLFHYVNCKWDHVVYNVFMEFSFLMSPANGTMMFTMCLWNLASLRQLQMGPCCLQCVYGM